MRTPGTVSISEPGRKGLTHEELHEFTGGIAARLRELGVSRKHRLAMVVDTGAEAVTCALSVMRCATALPLNPAYREAELEVRLRRLKADALLVGGGIAPAAADAAKRLGIPVIGLEADPSAPAGLFSLRAEVGIGPRQQSSESLPADVALLMETSGTTGQPKKVPLMQANLCASARFSTRSLELGPEDRLLGVVPMHHVVGVALALIVVNSGSGLYAAPANFNARFLDWMDEYRPTWIYVPPATLRDLAGQARVRREVVEKCGIRLIRSGSSSVAPEVLREAEEAFQAPVIEAYGMTEAAPLITCSPLPPAKRKAGSAGLPAGCELRIAGPGGVPARPGETGEILVRGPNVMSGYEDDAEANRHAFVDGWFRTGDLGWQDLDGYLFITGRVKELINRGGQKIAPREVEEALLRHPSVTEAAVFSMPHERLGEDVAAVVALRAGESASETELRRFATDLLADYKVPARVCLLKEIPKGPGGKVRRLELSRQLGPELAKKRSGPAKFVEPESALERQLARMWSEILRVERVGIDDDFFELGGDSFAAALLLAQVQESYALPSGVLERIDFMDAPTIGAMAKVIERGAGTEHGAGTLGRHPAAVALQPRGSRTPLFFVPWVDESPHYLLPLSRHLGDTQPFFVMRDPVLPEERGVYSLADSAGKYVEAMRAIQPKGPYLLGGHCLGGLVAFEAARQLRSSGEEVPLLVIVDAPTPGYPGFWRHRKLFARAVRYHLLELAGKGGKAARLSNYLQAVEAHIGRSVRSAAARLLWRIPESNGMLKTGTTVSEANMRAARLYRPATYPGRIILILAKEHPQSGSPLDRRLGWRELAEEGVEVHTVSGGHLTLLTEPLVEETAARLKELLARAAVGGA